MHIHTYLKLTKSSILAIMEEKRQMFQSEEEFGFELYELIEFIT